MNRLYHDPKDSSAFAEKREYVNLDEKTIKRFWSKVDISEGSLCWEWQGSFFDTGYGFLTINVPTERGNKTVSAHRTSFCISRGYLPTGLHVCHKCDNRRCVRPDHLFSGTARDNLLDMASKGRSLKGDRNPSRTQNSKMPRGVRHGNSVFTDDVVQEIRWFCDQGCTYPQVAALYGANSVTIGYIARRQTWKHLPEESGKPFMLKRRNSERFSVEEIREIRTLRKQGNTLRAIALQFNVPSVATIHAIVSGKQYRNVI